MDINALLITAIGGAIAIVIGTPIYDILKVLLNKLSKVFEFKDKTANIEIFPDLVLPESTDLTLQLSENVNIFQKIFTIENSNSEKITIIRELMHVFGFNESDLRANRHLKITSKQCWKLLTIQGKVSVIICCFLETLIIVLIISEIELEAWSKFVLPTIIVFFIYLFTYIIFFKKIIQGTKIIYNEGTMHKSGDHISSYLLFYSHEQKRVFIHHELNSQMRSVTIASSSQRFRAYYAVRIGFRKNKRISYLKQYSRFGIKLLSVEPVQ